MNDSSKIHHVFLMCHRPETERWDASAAAPPGAADASTPVTASPATESPATGTPEAGGPGEPSADMPSVLYRLLQEHGYQVTLSRSPIESRRLLQLVRPSLIVMDPLVCAAGAIEFEAVSEIQGQRDPIPLVVLVDELSELRELRRVPALFKDFVIKPFRRGGAPPPHRAPAPVQRALPPAPVAHAQARGPGHSRLQDGASTPSGTSAT